MKGIRRIIVVVAALAGLYLVGALILTSFATKRGPAVRPPFRNFKSVVVKDVHRLPPVRTMTARDGVGLAHRMYPGSEEAVLIFLHGAAAYCDYLAPLGLYLARTGAASVYTPDLRGHGRSGRRRGDVAYVGQLEDDLEDLVALIRKEKPNAKIFLGGHSLGGGLALRFAPRGRALGIVGYVLVAPFIDSQSPMTKQGAGFAHPNLPRLLGLSMLNVIGITGLNSKAVILFEVPEMYRTPLLTAEYSYSLLMSTAPGRKAAGILRDLREPLLVVAARDDELLNTSAFPNFFQSNPNARLLILEGEDHLGIVASPRALAAMAAWLREKRGP